MLFAIEASLCKNIINKVTYDEIIKEFKDIPYRYKYVQKETLQLYNRNKKVLTSMTVLYSCGFIQGYAVATEAALKIGETVKIPSFAYEAEEYIHGPNLQLTPRYTVFFIDDFSIGSKRLLDIYKATQSVTDNTFIITNSQEVEDDHALRLPFNIIEPLLSPLYTLPIFHILSYLISEKLNSWDNHPMFKDFKKYAESKTRKGKEIMYHSR